MSADLRLTLSDVVRTTKRRSNHVNANYTFLVPMECAPASNTQE
jgi:hypothetical protein